MRPRHTGTARFACSALTRMCAPAGDAGAAAAPPEVEIIDGAGAAPGDLPGADGVGGVGAGAGAAGATAAGAAAGLRRAWVENKPKRGRPKGSKTLCKRVSKKARTVVLGSQVGSSSSSRCTATWSAEAKGYALAKYDSCGRNVAAAVRFLLRDQPELFGSGRGVRSNGQAAAPLSDQLLASWVEKRAQAQAGGSSSLWFATRFGGKRASRTSSRCTRSCPRW